MVCNVRECNNTAKQGMSLRCRHDAHVRRRSSALECASYTLRSCECRGTKNRFDASVHFRFAHVFVHVRSVDDCSGPRPAGPTSYVSPELKVYPFDDSPARFGTNLGCYRALDEFREANRDHDSSPYRRSPE